MRWARGLVRLSPAVEMSQDGAAENGMTECGTDGREGLGSDKGMLSRLNEGDFCVTGWLIRVGLLSCQVVLKMDLGMGGWLLTATVAGDPRNDATGPCLRGELQWWGSSVRRFDLLRRMNRQT